MANNDPAYVRLVDRLARGCQVDLESGWSIAGMDVMEFPDEDQPLAVAFVRNALARGVLEGCSKAEYEEVMEQDRDYLAAAGVTVNPPEIEGHYNESHVVQAAEQHRRQLEAARGFSASGGLSYRDDTVRRKRIAAHQYALEHPDEDEASDDDLRSEADSEVEAAGGTTEATLQAEQQAARKQLSKTAKNSGRGKAKAKDN